MAVGRSIKGRMLNIATLKFSDAIERAQGRPTGFDYMRMVLAVGIIGFHSIVTCYGAIAQRHVLASSLGWTFNLILPMFFALSGFLVAGSLQRNSNVGRFLWLRIIRIYPALIFDTAVCALLLGPLLTTLPWREYFQSRTFLAYTLNSLGLIHYFLPGVFETNPISKVNAQLWTIPVELECYLVLGCLALLGLARKPRVFAGVTIVACFLFGTWNFLVAAPDMVRFLVPGNVLVLCFIAGVALYLCREHVTFSKGVLVVAVAAFVASVAVPPFVYFSPIPAAYVTCYLGCLNPQPVSFIKRFDVSYGLFLYGYPVQQTVVWMAGGTLSWYGNIAWALPITFFLACASLFLVERPVQAWLKSWSLVGIAAKWRKTTA